MTKTNAQINKTKRKKKEKGLIKIKEATIY
jgi:hypothetical protein